MKKIYVLNGPNLNRLGKREPSIYGYDTLADVEALCRKTAGDDFEIVFMQSNREYEIIDAIHEATDEGDGLIINPAGFTFTSVAIVDALKMFQGPKVELHISNVHAREAMYHDSKVSPVVTAIVAGMGVRGYKLALLGVMDMLADAG